MNEQWDAPNQQVVRGDQSAPWDEGEGGSPPVEGEGDPKASPYDGLTKDELLDEADVLGVDVPSTATKAEIRAALEAAA